MNCHSQILNCIVSPNSKLKKDLLLIKMGADDVPQGFEPGCPELLRALTLRARPAVWRMFRCSWPCPWYICPWYLLEVPEVAELPLLVLQQGEVARGQLQEELSP